jgi:hypothetical protein
MMAKKETKKKKKDISISNTHRVLLKICTEETNLLTHHSKEKRFRIKMLTFMSIFYGRNQNLGKLPHCL